MNIAAATISTKKDRSTIDWAGVDTGAKIFVGLRGGCEGSANAVTAAQKKTSAGVTCTHGERDEPRNEGLLYRGPKESDAPLVRGKSPAKVACRNPGRRLSPGDWVMNSPWRRQQISLAYPGPSSGTRKGARAIPKHFSISG